MSIQTALAIEPQPCFPVHDISEANAKILELVLSNEEELSLNHGIAEEYSRVYRLGHPAIQSALLHTSLDFSIQDAMNHGIMTYEAICTLVQHLPIPDRKSAELITYNATSLTYMATADEVVDYFTTARKRFEQRMPLTAGVVYNASERLLGSMADYALHGAAMARQFDYTAVA